MTCVVREAQTWIGTPYVHQASVKGAGCDCLGLIRGIWRSLKGMEPDVVPFYSADWGEAQGYEILLHAASTHLNKVADDADIRPGQVLLFRMRQGAIAKHLGVVSMSGAAPKFIHAYSKHGVVESALTDPWRRRVVARFAFQEG